MQAVVLAAAQRLRRSGDFAAAVRGGRRAGRGARGRPPDPDPAADQPSRRTRGRLRTRAGFVVSKAVGNAVVRNRVRRRLRHLVRERLADLPAGATLVVRALPGAADARRTPSSAPISTRALAAARPPRGPAAVDDDASDARDTGARMLTVPIVAYRRWISPALPARCRFYPSCSAYALEAVARHGALRGTGLAIWRLLRCHPFHPGGYDPVPDPGRADRPAPT